MPITGWRLAIQGPAGGTITYKGMTDEISELTEFPVGGDGDCLEANFLGKTTLGLVGRSIVVFQTTANGTDWDDRWRGLNTTVVDPRSKKLERYQLMGFKQRLYEIFIDEPFIEADTCSVMVTSILTQAKYRPDGSTGFVVPVLGFSEGRRYPNKESVGSFLDFMASRLGGFVVPTATTYVYDGETYTAGQYVPPVTWGVNAAGVIFFRRAQNSRAYVDGTGGVTVDYSTASAEGVVSKVIVAAPGTDNVNGDTLFWRPYDQPDGVEFLPAMAPGFFVEVEDPDTHDDYNATKRVESAPILKIKSFTGSTATATNVLDPADAIDGDGATFAEDDVAGSDASAEIAWDVGRIDAISISYESNFDVLLQVWNINSDDPSAFATTRFEQLYKILLLKTDDNTGSGTKQTHFAIIPPDVRRWYPPDLDGEFCSVRLSVEGGAGRVTKVYEIVAYEIDVEAMQAVGQAYFVKPAGLPASIIKTDFDTPVAKVDVTAASQTNNGVRVGSFSYKITKDPNQIKYTTTVKLEQANNADLEAQAEIIKRLIKKESERVSKVNNFVIP
jgi:hypothetical protein